MHFLGTYCVLSRALGTAVHAITSVPVFMGLACEHGLQEKAKEPSRVGAFPGFWRLKGLRAKSYTGE